MYLMTDFIMTNVENIDYKYIDICFTISNALVSYCW